MLGSGQPCAKVLHGPRSGRPSCCTVLHCSAPWAGVLSALRQRSTLGDCAEWVAKGWSLRETWLGQIVAQTLPAPRQVTTGEIVTASSQVQEKQTRRQMLGQADVRTRSRPPHG
jgi:hypothetical protein